jgi:hypothetical protein
VGLTQQGEPFFLGRFAQAVDVAGHVHQFRRGQALQVLEDGFDHAHFSSDSISL